MRLGDLLRHVGVAPGGDAKYVCFRGPQGELPKGADGSYGTSLRLPYALDDSNDVIIAYKQNGGGQGRAGPRVRHVLMEAVRGSLACRV